MVEEAGFSAAFNNLDQQTVARRKVVRTLQSLGCKIYRDNNPTGGAEYLGTRASHLAHDVIVCQDLLTHGIAPMTTLADRNMGIDTAGILSNPDRDNLRSYCGEALNDNPGTAHDDSRRMMIGIAICGDTKRHNASTNAKVDALYNWLIADIQSFRAALPYGTIAEPFNGSENGDEIRGLFGDWPPDWSRAVNRAKALELGITIPSDLNEIHNRYDKFAGDCATIWNDAVHYQARSVHTYRFSSIAADYWTRGDLRTGFVGEYNVKRQVVTTDRGYLLNRFATSTKDAMVAAGATKITMLFHSPADGRFLDLWQANDGSTVQLWDTALFGALLTARTMTPSDFDGCPFLADEPETAAAIQWIARSFGGNGFW